MIRITNVTFGYKRKRPLLSDFSLLIEEGKIYGLLGKNGAGKSTLLHLISGLLIPQTGEVLIGEENISKRPAMALADIFIVPEEFELPAISLKKYIKCNAGFYPKFSSDQLEKYLACFDMDADIDLGALSMGQKKKVFMSFALATNTSILVMDEPTNGLDIQGKSQFRKFMAMGMNDNKTILISTHQVQDVDKLLDHIIVIDNNEVLLNATVTSITSKLSFVENRSDLPAEDVVYMLPSIKGNSYIVENKSDDETPLNLEILYHALLNNRERISLLFNTKEKL